MALRAGCGSWKLSARSPPGRQEARVREPLFSPLCLLIRLWGGSGGVGGGKRGTPRRATLSAQGGVHN